MNDRDATRFAGRSAAGFFVVGGLASLLRSVVALAGDAAEINLLNTRLVGLAAVGTGAVLWILPWERWHHRVTLSLAALGLAFIVAGDLLSGTSVAGQSGYTHPAWFILVFVWIGLTQTPRTALAAAPVAAVAYIYPLGQAPDASVAVSSAFIVLPVCVLVGETISWAVSRLREARYRDQLRIEHLETLVETNTLLNGDLDVGQAADVIARVANDLLQGTSAAAYLLDADRRLVLAGTFAVEPTAALMVATADDDASAQRALAGTHLSVESCGSRHGEPCDGRLALITLMGTAGTVGLVGVHRPANYDDSFVRQILQLLSAQAGAALEQRRAIEALTDAAMRDVLTGVGNRRHASVLLDSVRSGDALVLIDLDNFKLVNDNEGHAVGDDVLRDLGAFLRSSLRDDDAVARYGGEEFLLVLRRPKADPCDLASRLIERWRATQPRTTFSAGVAVHESNDTAATTLRMADLALYEAKHTGRDRACAHARQSPTAA